MSSTPAAGCGGEAVSRGREREQGLKAHSCNFFGMLHGGCIFTLVDCIGTAVIAGAGKAPGVTVNCSVNFLSPAPPGSVVVVEGNVLKVGKTLQVSHWRRGIVPWRRRAS